MQDAVMQQKKQNNAFCGNVRDAAFDASLTAASLKWYAAYVKWSEENDGGPAGECEADR